MEPWPQIPDDVVAWFRGVFAEANRRVCERLTNVPNIRETSLDDGLVEALIPDSAPMQLPSGAIVLMDTHNIGGLRRFGRPFLDFPMRRRWETADIAVLVFIYKDGDLVAKKIGLLQSKRLYPQNNDVEIDDELDFLSGMNRFLRREGSLTSSLLGRTYVFDEDCVYGAIHRGDPQHETIERMNADFGKAVYYLLYNPHVLPLSVSYPVRARQLVAATPVGCRVLDADHVGTAIDGLAEGASPTFRMLLEAGEASNWPLETWAADLLLTCKVGQQFDDTRDSDVHYLLERRSGPIGAAIAASINLP